VYGSGRGPLPVARVDDETRDAHERRLVHVLERADGKAVEVEHADAHRLPLGLLAQEQRQHELRARVGVARDVARERVHVRHTQRLAPHERLGTHAARGREADVLAGGAAREGPEEQALRGRVRRRGGARGKTRARSREERGVDVEACAVRRKIRFGAGRGRHGVNGNAPHQLTAEGPSPKAGKARRAW
jgi:hypothetical protein